MPGLQPPTTLAIGSTGHPPACIVAAKPSSSRMMICSCPSYHDPIYSPISGYAPLLLPAQAGQEGDGVSAAHGEASQAHAAGSCRPSEH